MQTIHFHNLPKRAHTLVEMLIVISIISVLSSIASMSYKGNFESAERAISIDFVEQLNNALKEYEQNVKALTIAANDAVTTEENNIVDLLQAKDITVFGSPFFRSDWQPITGNDPETYRIRWNGVTFEIIEQNSSGTGLEIRTDGSDIATS